MTVAASLLLGSGAASAADIYTSAPGGGYKDEPVYAVNTWGGFYLGTNGGRAWSSHAGDLNVSSSALFSSASANAKDSPSGGFAGGQIGYNWQRGGLVLGIEGDFDLASVYDKPSAAALAGGVPFPLTATTATAKSKLDDFGTLRGRAGYSFGSLLIYGTGGFAYGNVQDRLSVDSPLNTSGSVSSERTVTGWAAGAGFEYALTPTVSWKAEYLHFDLGSTSLSQPLFPGTGASLTVHHDYDIVRTGLNYRLGSNEPLAVLGLFGGGLKDSPAYGVSWTGFYGGINSGSNSSEHDGTLTVSNSAGSTTVTNGVKESPSGPFGGGQIGYNWQFGHYVLGIEGDLDAAAVQDRAFATATSVGPVPGGTTGGTTQGAAKSDLDYFGTLRARAGYSYGRFLVYGTGGLAYGGVRDRLNVTNINLVGGSTVNASANGNETATGWAAGAGFEVALTPQWSLKTEYLHLDLGTTTLSGSAVTAPGLTSGSATLAVQHDYDIVRSGVNYHFGSYEPLK